MSNTWRLSRSTPRQSTSSAGPRRVSQFGPHEPCRIPPIDPTSLGELLASAGDDGNVILWVPSESHYPAFGSEGLDDKETWRAKHMCRSLGTEIYDLAWSPDASYFIIGSMDNVARIYSAGSGRQDLDEQRGRFFC